jgi:8-oxo-dGTP diphosphatase
MDTFDELNDFIQNGDKVYLSHFTIDCVIFGYEDRQLKVLLTKWIGLGWGLPGGFVRLEEALTDAAKRILKERTALDNVFLKQFHVFGDSSHRIKGRTLETDFGLNEGSWMLERTLSIGYYALMDCSKANVKLDFLVEDYKWVNVNEIPNGLMLDNNEVIRYALESIRKQIFHEPIGFELLPEKFTLPEIQTLYETILDKKFDRRNFPNKLLTQEIIIKLDEKRNIGQHRSPFLYKFHHANYHNALNDSLMVVI